MRRPFELVFPLDLSLTSFHSVTVHFAVVLSALDFGEFKRFYGSIYRNLRELWLFINMTWFWDVNRRNTYILTAFVD